MNPHLWPIILCLLLCPPAVSGASSDKPDNRDANTLEHVTLQLKWRHQFQFAGYYAALHQGFFRDEGLNVTLREGGPDIVPHLEVLAGRARYGVAEGGLVYQWLRDRPIVALATIFQHSPSVLMTRKGSGLTTPHDLAGKRVAMLIGGLPIIELAAMFINEGVNIDELQVKDEIRGPEQLFNNDVDAEYGYISNEPFLLRKNQLEVNLIQPASYGVDFYGDTLFTCERELRDHPDRVAALPARRAQGMGLGDGQS